MAHIVGGKLVGKDNRAIASPAGRENLVNQVLSPPPLRPIETGVYQTAKSITGITISGTTATVTCTGHGASVGNIVRISGAATKNYNGEFKVLSAADANTYTVQVFGNPSTSPSGTKLSRVRREGKA
jgi:hypothetical protein